MTLSEFLLARIAEDEAVAHRVVTLGSPKWLEVDGPWFCDEQSEHVAMSPARVLARCEADRRIVEDLAELDRDHQKVHTDSLWARRFQATVAVAHLATVYADHPDYREEWKP